MKQIATILSFLLPLLPVLVEAVAIRGHTSLGSGVSSTVVRSGPNALRLTDTVVASGSNSWDQEVDSEELWMWEYGQPPLYHTNDHRSLTTFDINATSSHLNASTSTANMGNHRGYRFAILPLTKAGSYGTMVTRGCKEAAQRLEDSWQLPVTCDIYGSSTDRNATDIFPEF